MIYIFKDGYEAIEEGRERCSAGGRFPKIASQCLSHISQRIGEDVSEILILTDEKVLPHYNYYFFEGYQKNDSLKMNTTQKKIIDNRVIRFHFTDFQNFKNNHEKYKGDIIFDDSGMPERLLYAHEFLEDKYIYSIERNEGELTGGLNKRKYQVIDLSEISY